MLKRTLIGIVRSFESTGEKAREPVLRTRHYSLPREKLWDETITLLKKLPGYKLLHEVQNVGEIVVEKRTLLGRTQDVTLTLFSINPVHSAIDIYSASRGSLGDFGSNYRTIVDIYSALDKKLAAHKRSSN